MRPCVTCQKSVRQACQRVNQAATRKWARPSRTHAHLDVSELRARGSIRCMVATEIFVYTVGEWHFCVLTSCHGLCGQRGRTPPNSAQGPPRTKTVMPSLRDLVISHPRAWLLYAVGLCLCLLCMPTHVFLGASMAWSVILSIVFGEQMSGAQPREPGAVQHNSASQREVIAATVTICLLISYYSTLYFPMMFETGRIVVDALMEPMAKWSCSTQGRAPNVLPIMFVGQSIGVLVAIVPIVVLFFPAVWYKSWLESCPKSLSYGDKVKMCLAIASTTCILSALPSAPVYRGGAWGSRLDKPPVGWMQFGLMRELDLAA